MSTDETLILLRRWHDGDERALADLVERNLPWIRQRVHQRLGEGLRSHGDTTDHMHDAFVEVLRGGQRFVVQDAARFRALLARIIENVLRKRHRFLHEARRDKHREVSLATDVVLDLDASVTRPSAAAARSETSGWVRLGLDLIDPDDREVLLLRQWQNLTFPAIGTELGISEEAARKRFRRALQRLGSMVRRIRAGDWTQIA